MKTKKLFTWLLCFMLMASILAIAACKDTAKDPVITISLDKTEASIMENQTVQINATVKSDGKVVTDKTVEWFTSNEGVATVSDMGLVTGIKEGNATITAKVGGDISQNCEITVTKAPAEIKWNAPETSFKIADDIIRFRSDREDKVQTAIAGLVSATEGETDLPVIIDDYGTFVKDADTNLYPIGKHTITYKTRTQDGETKVFDYEIEVVEGKTIDYYLYGKNSDTFTNANWIGGIGIRVAAKDAFIIPEGSTEMPAIFLNSANGKLLDLDDPMLVINNSDNDITFFVNDTAGVHIQMDKTGFVKMIFEGIQNDFWNENGQSKVTPSVFGSTEKVLKPGDIYFVVGNTETGNYYHMHDSTTTEKHWRDGRFIALNTIGGKRYGNMAQVKLGEQLITEAYTNQLPYAYSGMGALEVVGPAKPPALSDFLSGVVFYDDNGTFAPDTQISNDNVEVDYSSITLENGNMVAGTYQITYTVKDSTDPLRSAVIKRTVIVKTSPQYNYIYYLNGATEVYFQPNAAEFNKNYTVADLPGNEQVTMYDNKFTGNVPNAQYTVYAVINKYTGQVLEMQDWSKLYNAENPLGGTITSANNKEGAKLRFETLTDDELLIIFAQGGTNNPVRTFGVNLLNAVKGETFKEIFLEIKDLAGVSTPMDEMAISFINNGTYHSRAVSTVTVNAETATANNDTLYVYNREYTGVKQSNINFNFIIVFGSDGKVKAIADGGTAKLHTENNVAGEVGLQQNMLKLFKLNDEDTNLHTTYYELQEGDTLYFGYHTGTAKNVRDFMMSYASAVLKNSGTTLAEKTIDLSFINF